MPPKIHSILGIMPLSALFILFDAIVQNPSHQDTRANLTLLDIASGHFSQLEHVSAGALPGNHLSEFAHIARRYVQELPPSRSAAGPGTGRSITRLGTTQLDASLEDGAARDRVSAVSGAKPWASPVCVVYLTFKQVARDYEIESSDTVMDDLANNTVFDGSIYFDDFTEGTEFLSDVDVRALLSSSFLM